ncbi:MAG TPA: glycosyltransferase family 4 protein [Polyangiaceae bacterium]|nr:glycosyltransferase family 4 protein [Polyangiaceae bacterium]
MTPPGDGGPRHCRSVLVTTSYPSSPDDASGHFVAAEVRARRARGEHVTVLAPRVAGSSPSPEPDVRWLPAYGAFGWPGALARLRERPWRAFGAMRFVLAARRALACIDDAERVVAHFIVPSAWPIAARARLPLEVVAHGSDVRLIGRLPAPLRRRVARRLAGAEVRCASEELRHELLRALGPLPHTKLLVAAPVLELTRPWQRDEARAELGVDARARLIVVVGRLVAGKRVDLALRAAELVPGARVVVVGDGPERGELERRFPFARFVGQVPRSRALAWLAAADVLLSASALEGAPSVVREARALGTRVVAVEAGDLAAWGKRDAGLCVLEARP